MKNIFLVDADDTLLDFHGASALAIRSAFKRFNVRWEDRFLTVFKEINDGLWEALERKELTRAELIEKRFPLYLNTLGMSHIDGAQFNEQYLHALATNPIYMQGAESFLHTLQSMGKIYIVTNGTQWIQQSRFDICGLWSYAEKAFISQVVGADKPSPIYTQYVVDNIECFNRENAIWIGDSLSADIRAANEANITSVWFNPHKKPLSSVATPTYIVNDFTEILTILKKING